MITKQEIEKLANLARIKVDNEEIQSLASDISSILSYVDEIKKVNMDMDSKANVGAVSNIYRQDISIPSSQDTVQAILNESPDKHGDFIAVKKIISQD